MRRARAMITSHQRIPHPGPARFRPRIRCNKALVSPTSSPTDSRRIGYAKQETARNRRLEGAPVRRARNPPVVSTGRRLSLAALRTPATRL